MPEIYDNLTTETQLGSGLTRLLQASYRMDVATGYFNLRGWKIFCEEVERKILDKKEFPIARILVGMLPKSAHTDLIDEYQQQMSGINEGFVDRKKALALKTELILALRDQLTQGCPTKEDREVLAKLQDQIRSGAVQIKIHTDRPLHGKTYILHREDTVQPMIGIVGSSNLTLAGLTHNLELNTDIRDLDGTRKLANWFEDRWNNRFSLPLDDDILKVLEDSWASQTFRPPYEVFLKVCYDLSKDAREGISEYSLSPLISHILLDYQSTAVRTLAKRIVNRRGTMLGDVVGLGKTLTAIAVALMLRDEHGYQPLVLCPKNLVSMWQEQLDAFELAGKVVSYSRSNELELLRRYQFVIVDESHTLRNEKTGVYRNVKTYITENESKVLLLTATPYNLAYSDVANQLGLFISDDEDLGLQPTNALSNPDFKRNLEFGTSTLAAFRKSDDAEDWKRLMGEFLVRRTRSFIRQNYAQVDNKGRDYLTFANGSRFVFPERKAIPVDHTFSADDPALKMVSDSTVDDISKLILPRYALHKYVIPDELITASENERKALGDAEQSRGHVSGFVRTNFYKRLSSCGHSFILSLQRHLARNNLFLYAIENGLKLPTGDIDPNIFTTENDHGEFAGNEVVMQGNQAVAEVYARLREQNPKSVTWVDSRLFDGYLKADLLHDSVIIKQLLDSFGEWKITADSKLLKVKEILTQEHPNQKVLIFTEYKDTAEYICNALKEMGIDKIAVATGDVDDPTSLALRFSPKSNQVLREQRGLLNLHPGNELRVLVATDVLSEGQNLQDAHIVINYDIPWAIIQLIQRAGRIDRVGQESDEVLIYTLTHGGLEDVLRLRQRVQQRLGDNAKTFGSDEKFFDTDEEVQMITDLFQGKLAEESANEEVDAGSIAYEIWNRAVKDNPELAQRIALLPNLIDATRKIRMGEPEGVICHVQTDSGQDGFAWATENQQMLLTGHEAIRLLQVSADEPGNEQLTNHDLLVADLVKEGGILREHVNEIGRIRGVRERVWNRLKNDLLLSDDEQARQILETLHKNPFTREANDKLLRMLRNGADNASLIEILKAMERDNRLFVEKTLKSGKLSIVSVMGVKA